MFSLIFKKLFGSQNERYIKRKTQLVAQINALEERMQALSDDDMRTQICAWQEALRKEEVTPDELLPEVFALVREASNRVLGMRHFDVQLIGAMTLHGGRIAEMRTGEGKTLMATLAVVLNALGGKGVHVVTVNDYLAKRDAAWMGKLYNFLGLSVGVIVHGLSDEERKAAYAADVTYGTNNEFGFDYLRDNMKFYQNQLVQRKHQFAIVDEVDSILIDEARTPLIISGAADDSTDLYRTVNNIIPLLERETHFTLDEKAKTAMLTDAGVQRCEELLGVDNLFDMQNITLQHHVLQALKAHHAFRLDVDYVVTEGQVVIVDEFTGRPMPGRRFSDGLHQSLEAKEGVKVEAENQTLASITFQNYFRLYEKLSGMTGTADTEAVEFHEIYGLEVVSIPTHRPMVRKDLPDVVYRTRKEKYLAIVEQIKELHTKGQPVLVGTISIETSELLSTLLKRDRIPHNVLNAKHHEQEADIVAEAGQLGKVTIATNMAGRGTDIVLGDGVRELGGLFILGTERHESRRIDNQLRGRSGRQGDPGCSRFFLSLEDDLMRLFGSERIMKVMETLGLKDGECIEHRMISRAIENAQKRVEGHNFEIRKTLLDYDNVMNQQREVVYSLRYDAISRPEVEGLVQEFIDAVLNDLYAGYEAARGALSEEEKDMLRANLQDIFSMNAYWQGEELPNQNEARECAERMLARVREAAPEIYQDILRYFVLEELDRCWKEHLLNMDHLRDGIGLRGYGQRDPKQEYKREGFALFRDMLMRLQENVLKTVARLRFQVAEGQNEQGEDTTYLGVSVGQDAAEAPETATTVEEGPVVGTASVPRHNEAVPQAPAQQEPEQEFESASAQPGPQQSPFMHKDRSSRLSYSGAGEGHKKGPDKRETPKVGRNDDCPCGSGKKFKKCCGK
ncbi:preprotein translocase subunit SecA [Desulfovibrio cuneatus]|uniref:preprotein translocase subunit SecA n=1 Tax=Desulfovibrio cuneatus TaxID=159728 RepID=UPI000412F922